MFSLILVELARPIGGCFFGQAAREVLEVVAVVFRQRRQVFGRRPPRQRREGVLDDGDARRLRIRARYDVAVLAVGEAAGEADELGVGGGARSELGAEALSTG